jgi:ABC-2 type transport system permease protein
VSSTLSRDTPQAVRAVMRRDWLIARSYRTAYVLTFGAALFNVLAYYFISETFGGGDTARLDGAPSYFAFALVGIVITTVVQSSALAVARRLREEQLTGTLEAVAGQPLRDAELALGLAGYPFVFSGLRTIAYLVVAGLLFGVSFAQTDWLGLVVMLLATTAFLMGLGLVIAALTLLVKRAEALAGLATFGLAFLGGAFFPIDTFPTWLEEVARFAPTRLAYDGTRAAMYTGEGWGEDAAILALTAVVAVPIGVWSFDRALRRQRRRGTLGEY